MAPVKDLTEEVIAFLAHLKIKDYQEQFDEFKKVWKRPVKSRLIEDSKRCIASNKGGKKRCGLAKLKDSETGFCSVHEKNGAPDGIWEEDTIIEDADSLEPGTASPEPVEIEIPIPPKIVRKILKPRAAKRPIVVKDVEVKPKAKKGKVLSPELVIEEVFEAQEPELDDGEIDYTPHNDSDEDVEDEDTPKMASKSLEHDELDDLFGDLDEE